MLIYHETTDQARQYRKCFEVFFNFLLKRCLKQTMEAESTDSSFSKELSVCSFCKEQIDVKNGRLLLCLHSFCSQCLQNLTVAETNDEASPRGMYCFYVDYNLRFA